MGKGQKGKGKGKSRKGRDGGKPTDGSLNDTAGGEERSNHTRHFYAIDETLSSLQKAVRRGHCRNAAFWAGELHVSGLSTIAMRRLVIMAVEDIGIAAPYAVFIAAAAQSLILTLPDDPTSEGEVESMPSTIPPRLALVCGLAFWLSGLPKTRTSCMLSSFQRAKTEEAERTPGLPRRLVACSLQDVTSALLSLWSTCIGELDAWLTRGPMQYAADFLRMEEEVIMLAYAFQLSLQTEAEALQPLFEVLGQCMLTEERRLRARLPGEKAIKGESDSTLPRPCCESNGWSAAPALSMQDFVSGFAVVRRMVDDLLTMCSRTLATSARMALNHALFLATRAHYLVLEGVILLPSHSDKVARDADAGKAASRLDVIRCSDSCSACERLQLNGKAMARCNTWQLAEFIRADGNRASGSAVSVNLEDFVRRELMESLAHRCIPRCIYESLLKASTDPGGRLLRVPPYCIDIHTRRGSGYPMHLEWEQLKEQHPALEEWDAEEMKKTHGPLDAEGRRLASQFTKYGLIVSDEFFPGPESPPFDMALRPSNWKKFLSEGLPVASLDYGDIFIDRRLASEGYSASWDGSPSLSPLAEVSESMSALLRKAKDSFGQEQWCSCDATPSSSSSSSATRCPYTAPAMPHDPFFVASKTFMAWAAEKGFPAARDFPGGVLPKVFKTASGTIYDDPNGKRLTQVEHVIDLIDGTGQGVIAGERRSAIDARPSQVTELHRARLQDMRQRGVAMRPQKSGPGASGAASAPAGEMQAIEEEKPPSPAVGGAAAAAASSVKAGATASAWRAAKAVAVPVAEPVTEVKAAKEEADPAPARKTRWGKR